MNSNSGLMQYAPNLSPLINRQSGAKGHNIDNSDDDDEHSMIEESNEGESASKWGQLNVDSGLTALSSLLTRDAIMNICHDMLLNLKENIEIKKNVQNSNSENTISALENNSAANETLDDNSPKSSNNSSIIDNSECNDNNTSICSSIIKSEEGSTFEPSMKPESSGSNYDSNNNDNNNNSSGNNNSNNSSNVNDSLELSETISFSIITGFGSCANEEVKRRFNGMPFK
jgi:hypothetical protein